VGGDFECDNNQLTNLRLKNLPIEVNGDLYLRHDLKLMEIQSLYNDDGWVICDLSTLKTVLSAYELNQTLNLNLLNKPDTKKIKV